MLPVRRASGHDPLLRQQGPVRLAQDERVARWVLASPPPAAVSRRRAFHIMRENGLVSAYGRKRFKVHPGAVNEADVPNVVARGFGGRAPRTHICSDLTYVRVGASWNYVCLLVDPCNREIVGHSAGPRKDARLVKSAFATLSFPISDIGVIPHGPRQRVRQRRDRPDARGFRH